MDRYATWNEAGRRHDEQVTAHAAGEAWRLAGPGAGYPSIFPVWEEIEGLIADMGLEAWPRGALGHRTRRRQAEAR